VLLQIPV